MKMGKMLASAAVLSISGVAMTAVADAKEMKAAQNSEPALLQEWTGPYGGVPPWDQVKVSQFPSAFQAAMAAYKAEFEAIILHLGRAFVELIQSRSAQDPG